MNVLALIKLLLAFKYILTFSSFVSIYWMQ